MDSDAKRVDDVIRLAELSLQFGKTARATHYPGGEEFESDTDHTVMLGLIACAYAERFAPLTLE